MNTAILSTKIVKVDNKIPDNSGLDKKTERNIKLATLATKAELKAEQHKIVKFQTFNSSYFHGKTHFGDDGTMVLLQC